ncbi:hypothetical protein Nepgr_008632 [Nepenthes gracilis]|uniref:Succinate dehydrogenase assembly factor 4, mitochondrial n=1 Tax=Nepenthes gracilis TaxID=150966 RepID=A0AAD3XJF0_NEPGR|nr:hypothetical protein Nepgr_008632 [Nepenthes gracilis]
MGSNRVAMFIDATRRKLELPGFASDSVTRSIGRLMSSSAQREQQPQQGKSKNEDEVKVKVEDDVDEEIDDEDEDDGVYVNKETGEVGGPRGPEPTRYGDWEKGGRCSDF